MCKPGSARFCVEGIDGLSRAVGGGAGSGERMRVPSLQSSPRSSYVFASQATRGLVRMEVLFFLKRRTQFIRQFYETAGEPFREIQRKIDAGEAPFEPDPFDYSEDGEPPFLEEWFQAETSLEILGRTCISMVSASLKLYFETWEAELQIKLEKGEKEKYFKNGFVRGYHQFFGKLLKLNWDDCPIDFNLLEQVALARNNDQHPDSITTMQVSYRPKDRAKFPSLFFLSEHESLMYSTHDFPIGSWFQPAVHVLQILTMSPADSEMMSPGDTR
jgi:hypothetical protein